MLIRSASLAAALFLLAPWSFGQTILRVEFAPQTQPIPPAELDRLLPIHAGDSLDRAVVRTAIDKLYATGQYADIVVSSTSEGAGLVLRFETTPSEFFGQISIEGEDDPPSQGQLLTATKIESGTLFEAAAIEQAKRGILERLSANGFFQSKVEAETTRTPDSNEVHTRFKLTTGPRASFAGIRWEGTLQDPHKTILAASGWKRSFSFLPLPGWRKLTDAQLQNGLTRIREEYRKQDRLQAKVTLLDLGYERTRNTVTPLLRIEPGPLLEIRTSGASVPPRKLRQLVPVYQELAVDRGLLVEGRRNLIEYFQAQGYFDADADFVQTDPAPGRSVIEYSITRGDRHVLARVNITGNHYFTDDTLRSRLSIEPATWLRYHSGRFSQSLLEKDRAAIEGLYKANGFRDAVVKARVDDNAGGLPGHLAALLEVEEGPQFLVGGLSLEGISDDDARQLRNILQSVEGQPYSTSAIASDRDAILGYYFNNGYPDASFDWAETEADSDPKVFLRFEVRPGRRQFVRGVMIHGLGATRRSLVEERIRITPGDPLSQASISASQQRLYDLGIFSKVQTALQNPDGEEESKVVLFNFTEASRYSFNAGAGAEIARIGGGTTTFDAPAGQAGFSPRISLGISRLNFWGLGHTASIQGLASTLRERALFSYVVPQFVGDERLSLSFTALFDDSRDVRTFAARRWEGSTQISQKLSRANTLQFRYTFRRVTVDPGSLKISPELIPILSQPVRVGMLSLSFVQDRRDDPAETKRGIYNTVDIGVALREFASETSFTRILYRNSTYHPIARGVTLARSFQFGYLQRLGGLSSIPLAERYFAGGASSHRAFPDNQAGPRDLETGFPLGGSALLFHSTELRFPLIGDNIGGVLFHDMGNVYSDVRDITFRTSQKGLQDFNYMVHAAGLGVRYKTPLGPVRVDFSLSPNSPRFFGFAGTRDQLLAGQGVLVNQRINVFQFHFSLGQTF